MTHCVRKGEVPVAHRKKRWGGGNLGRWQRRHSSTEKGAEKRYCNQGGGTRNLIFVWQKKKGPC